MRIGYSVGKLDKEGLQISGCLIELER